MDLKEETAPVGENELILKLAEGREVISIKAYNGVCDSCGGVLILPDTGVYYPALSFRGDAVYMLMLLEHTWMCPHCGAEGRILRIWKTLEISGELQGLGHPADKEARNG